MLTASVESKGFVIPSVAFFHDSTTLRIVGRRDECRWLFSIELIVVHRTERGSSNGKPVYAYTEIPIGISSCTINDGRLKSKEALALVKRWLHETQCQMFGLRMSFIDQTSSDRDETAKAIAFILRTPEITAAFEDEGLA